MSKRRNIFTSREKVVGARRASLKSDPIVRLKDKPHPALNPPARLGPDTAIDIVGVKHIMNGAEQLGPTDLPAQQAAAP